MEPCCKHGADSAQLGKLGLETTQLVCWSWEEAGLPGAGLDPSAVLVGLCAHTRLLCLCPIPRNPELQTGQTLMVDLKDSYRISRVGLHEVCKTEHLER